MPRPRDTPPKGQPPFIPPEAGDALPFVLELWNPAGTAPQSVLAVAANQETLQHMVKAARKEYPDRTLVLRQGPTVLRVLKPSG